MVDPQVIAFTAIAALLTITPGADTMMILRSVFTRGQRAGILTMIGICSGLFFHGKLSALSGPRVKRGLETLSGAILIAFGVRLAVEHR